jgi:hypothetical protein
MTRESTGAGLDREERFKDTGYVTAYECTCCSYLSLKLIYDVSGTDIHLLYSRILEDSICLPASCIFFQLILPENNSVSLFTGIWKVAVCRSCAQEQSVVMMMLRDEQPAARTAVFSLPVGSKQLPARHPTLTRYPLIAAPRQTHPRTLPAPERAGDAAVWRRCL